MELKDEIKAYIVSSGWSITDLNKELNNLNNTEYTVQNLSSKIRKGSLKYSEVLQIAEIIGYEIEWNRKKD
ncbi:LLM class flavin-dependent oxidoreductase [Clostridium botulinum]|uniref:LLM class flavin-dependent oxidoreductase n=2 Tax=Clostridium botulinum TaxID=1491 RepID=UPI0013CA2424|nr:LLM class flavin-dependent oxidoreductase [Clostridium botulinum]MBY6761802.1 LLM class flavin-dependent oxidoreductase [Clostridium botulinum]NFE73396.1 LLM class flavin-dependent oxidoreductase [Clostridium botulinum]NFG27264.1 LLM class flavin-dependent oxidoreductase [Clostridium botulinum]NFO66348.1 LLM class flavin-dependent oxidoreductase [Clostridium botulinum]